MAIASINPATGEKLKEFSPFDDAEIEKRLTRAENAFRKYRRTTFTERSELLHAVAELLLQEKKKFARNHHAGDGEIVSRFGRRNREMRARLPILRRERRAIFGGRD